MIQNVPSPIDLFVISDAREWEVTVLAKSPVRPHSFARFAAEILSALKPVQRVLQLRSGPVFFAQYLLALHRARLS